MTNNPGTHAPDCAVYQLTEKVLPCDCHLSNPVEQLIKKLEAGTEGSRELDSLIYLELHPKHLDNLWRITFPHYTTSIDAALTLVPEEHFGGIRFGVSYNAAWVRRAGEYGLGEVTAPTPALALVIASFKARSAS